MGVKYVKRGRMQSLPAINAMILYSLGSKDINFEIYDEQELYYIINQQYNAAQVKINARLNQI